MTQKEEINSYKQPRGLYLLFFTELWERFGFYTVQTIIILYMTKALQFSDVKANLLYASFSSLLYLTPALGGYIADRYLGFQKAIMIGGLLLMIGYIFTAFQNQTTFFYGLCILIIANGLFKPNVSSIVGTLYGENDPRRDGGFTLFYMGINIGALIPPIFMGALVKYYGWHWGYAIAALGMGIGFITFLFGKYRLGDKGAEPSKSPLFSRKRSSKTKFNIFFYPGLIFASLLIYVALMFPATTDLVVEIGSAIILLFIFYILFLEPPTQRKRLIAALILIIFSIGFWALYNQTFTSLTLFADRNMEQHFLGIPVDAEAMQFFNPFFIIVLSPVLSRLWIYLSRKNINLSFPTKFALGIFLVSMGFLLLAFATKFYSHNGIVSSHWLVLSYFLQTLGELLLSPIGLSMITVLSPENLTGLMMGVWFLSQAAAFAIGGSMANLAAIPDHTNLLASLAIYHHAFTLFGFISLLLALIAFAVIPFLNKMVKTNLV